MIPKVRSEAAQARPPFSVPASLSVFLDDWLPAQFRALCAADPEAGRVPCSLLLQLGADRWWLGVENRILSVEGGVVSRPALLRLDASVAAFVRLVVEAGRGIGAANPALRLLQIDAQRARDVSAVSGAVRLLVRDAEEVHELVLGPGAQSAEVVCTLRCELADLRSVQSGDVQPLDLFIAGKLGLEGDPAIAVTLGSMFL
jgi:SCP-2 sterol transfer family